MTRLTLVAALTLAACTPTPPAPLPDPLSYPPPEDSGLVGARAYPDDSSPCQVIGENDLTIDYLDDTELLIGCPVAASEAIAARVAEGASPLTQIGDWALLTVNLR